MPVYFEISDIKAKKIVHNYDENRFVNLRRLKLLMPLNK